MILSYRFVFYFSFSLKSGNLSVNLDNLVLDQRTFLIYIGLYSHHMSA